MSTESLCRKALAAHEAQLLALPNVEGLSVREGDVDVADSTQPEMFVVVYVDEKIPKDKLNPADIIPASLSVETDDGTPTSVPTRVYEIGTLSLE